MIQIIFEPGDPKYFSEIVAIPMDSFQGVGENRAPEPLESLANIMVAGAGGNDPGEHCNSLGGTHI